MRFLVDMNLAVPVAAWLRGRGHDAVHLLGAGLADLPDSAVLAKAHAEGRVLPTCDLDFGELLADPGGPRASVVLFRVTSQRLDRVPPRLSRMLDECASAPAAGAIVVADETRIGVRHLPLRP